MSTVFLYLVLSLPLVGVYAMLGLGITAIYQASRVLNLAHGAVAMGAAYVTYLLTADTVQLNPAVFQHVVIHWHLPIPFGVVGGVIFGTTMGIVVERFLVRRLRSAGPTTQTVGTVAVLSLAIALATLIFTSNPVPAAQVLPQGTLVLGTGFVKLNALLIFPIGLLGALALFALLEFTDIGLAMRGAAQNRRGASLRGIDPDRTTMLAWAVGGAFAGMAGVVYASANGLDPFSVPLGLTPAFVAALIGGLDSMPGVMVGAGVVGLTQGMVPAMGFLPKLGPLDIPGFIQAPGSEIFVLGVLALVVMARRGSRLSVADNRGG